MIPVRRANGPAAAAILAAALGTATIGLMTTLAEISGGLKNALNWYNPSGPLSGKTGVGVIVWLVGWMVFTALWRGRNVDVGKVLTWTLVLVLLGFVGTFPPVFEAFAK